MLAAVLGAAAAPGVANPAAGAAVKEGLSACTATSGVLVAVVFSHWGGSVSVGCASGRQPDGLDSMRDAGFLTAGDEADGDAFVCRIGVAAKGLASERPTSAEDPCVSTPPASAYWAFWVADPGGDTWDYSDAGVTAYQPPAGSIEGWTFGAGGRPTVTPAQLRAKVASATAALGRAGSARIVAVPAGAGVRTPGGSGGTPTGLLVTVGAVAVLAAGGGMVARRRRRAA